MFIVKNNSIQNEKTMDIGKERFITLSFYFQGAQFEDTDTFSLSYGTLENANYSFTNDGYLKFVKVPFDFISNASTSVALIITKNGSTQILDDSITVTAQVDGGSQDLSDYATKSYVSSELSGYATTSYADGLINNQLKINQITDDTDTIALSYSNVYDIVEVSNTTNTASITINPCSGYTAESGKVPTFELWIIPTTKKTTISVSNSIQVVGDLPSELDANVAHCFVFRFVGNDQLLNYSYSFTPTASSTSSESNSSI